jgi:hypothetical protein
MVARTPDHRGPQGRKDVGGGPTALGDVGRPEPAFLNEQEGDSV